MSYVRGRVLVGAMAMLAVAAAPAEARVSADAAAKRRPLRVASLTRVPASVRAGRTMRVRVKVKNPAGKKSRRARLTYSLRTSRKARHGTHLRGITIPRIRAHKSRSFLRGLRIP